MRHHLAVSTKQAVFMRQAISQALKVKPDLWDTEQRRELTIVAEALAVPAPDAVGTLVVAGYVSVGDDGQMQLTERGRRAAVEP